MRDRTSMPLKQQKATGPSLAQNAPVQHNPGMLSWTAEEATSQSADTDVRTTMQPGFGHDFSQVRIHRDEPVMLQRQATDATPAAPFDPLGPKVMSQAAAQVIAAEQDPVRTWLDSNTARLSTAPKEQIVIQVQQNVPQAAKLADAEIQMLVDEWARRNHVALSDGRSDPYSKIATAALGALSLANDGVVVIPSPVEVKVGITGATATLKTGDVDFEASLGINREVELAVSYGNFKFSAKFSAQKWSLTLSFGADDVPDLDGLTKTFSEGEKSLRRIASDPASLRDPENASNAKEALDSLANIVKSVPKRIEISVGSADSSGSAPGAQQGGWQVMVKITVLRF